MISFIAKRLFYGFLVLLGVITVLFILFQALPSPARMMLGQRMDITSVEAINKDLGLDKPVVSQYFNYLNDISPISFHSKNPESYWFLNPEKYEPFVGLVSIGNFKTVLKKPYLRRSYQSKKNVSEIIMEALPNTALLATVSMIFAAFFGILLGIISAIKKNSIIDKLILVLSVFGMSLPSFFAAILIAWIFAFLLSDFTGLNMVGSLYEVDDFGVGEYMNIKNLILPAFTLGIRPLAIITELTRSSLLDVLSQDYIRTAKAKGLSFYKVISKHALKNAMNPVITAISGWFASLMAGAVFVEYVFDWKGLGVVIVNSLDKYDFPVVMGAILLISILLVIINIIVDISYGWLDPRVRITN